MAIENTRVTAAFIGTGKCQDYPLQFPAQTDAGNVTVRVTDDQGEDREFLLGRDYTISVIEDETGTPTDTVLKLTEALPAGWSLVALRTTAITQDHRFTLNEGYLPQEVERALDRLTMICQELAAHKLDRDEFEGRLREIEEELRASMEATTQEIQAEIQRLDRDKVERDGLEPLLEADAALAVQIQSRMPQAPSDGRRYEAMGGFWIEAESGGGGEGEGAPSGLVAESPFFEIYGGRVRLREKALTGASRYFYKAGSRVCIRSIELRQTGENNGR